MKGVEHIAQLKFINLTAWYEMSKGKGVWSKNSLEGIFNGNEDSVQAYGVGWLLLCGWQFCRKDVWIRHEYFCTEWQAEVPKI